jgi:hypothetical protein
MKTLAGTAMAGAKKINQQSTKRQQRGGGSSSEAAARRRRRRRRRRQRQLGGGGGSGSGSSAAVAAARRRGRRRRRQRQCRAGRIECGDTRRARGDSSWTWRGDACVKMLHQAGEGEKGRKSTGGGEITK